MASPPIPITIVTGFLGSGKTTLILSLLPQLQRHNPAYRLALVKNEFGDLAVDSQLASASALTGVRELLNGCICCNLVGQLGPALDELAERLHPDRIVIETSGSAFPATLALEVNRLARSSGRFLLDGVISLVDVENWQGYEDTSYTAKIQARYTDLIVLNKWEAAGPDRYEYCLDRLGDIDVDLAKVKTDRGSLDVDLVFGIDRALARNLPEDELEPEPDAHHHHHQQEVDVLSVQLQPADCQAAVDTDHLLAFLAAAPKDEVYRIKAVLTLSSTPTNSDPDLAQPAPQAQGRYILNWAFGRWTFTPIAAAAPEHPSSKELSLRMTLILARHESAKWKKKLESASLLASDNPNNARLVVHQIT